ncbi:MAG TPA: YvcK family protein [Desulfobacterales bacterium]|nr:YvcK family protein [Desulfobacterales bacterium]
MINDCLQKLASTSFTPLDIVQGRNLTEKLVELALHGPPEGMPMPAAPLKELTGAIHRQDVSGVRVVVFGGGTGMSTIIGGDSRSPAWTANPFQGLKSIFPQIRAVVCVSDDGGSTGELLKHLPLFGIGDLRHVLLAAIQESLLRKRYNLDSQQALETAAALFTLFNYRYEEKPLSVNELLRRGGLELNALPAAMADGILYLLRNLFSDSRLSRALSAPNCLGNLLIVSAIYSGYRDDNPRPSVSAVRNGLLLLTDMLGVVEDGVMPCTLNPSSLKIHYTNGVMTTGEYKSGLSRRGYPVERVFVDFLGLKPQILPQVFTAVREADIIIFAPGSLYTSIVPVMQVPGLAEAVRANEGAMKVLAANIWVQAGETDLTMDEPKRRFYVSDLIKAYNRNIVGGVHGLFQQVLLLGLQDIPGSILQNYAVEGKVPIYLDRGLVWKMGFEPVEACIYAADELAERRLKHEPAALALAIKAMWAARGQFAAELTDSKQWAAEVKTEADLRLPAALPGPPMAGISWFAEPGCRTAGPEGEIACERYARINRRLTALDIEDEDRGRIAEIIWHHADIPAAHLDYTRGLRFIERRNWPRSQVWDKVYSFYNPEDGFLNIRRDIGPENFEVAFLVALGQSLLGNYAAHKDVEPLLVGREIVGKLFRLELRPAAQRLSWFSDLELRSYLKLSRLLPSAVNPLVFTRAVNGEEGFTPPGLLFGLTYAWYIDNRFADHIEYKMAIARAEVSDLVPEQVKTLARRRAIIDFFREVVFCQ